MFSVAAQRAREHGSNGNGNDAATGGVTTGGLARRVPGAQRPDAALADRAPAPAEEPAPRSSPEDVYSFLSNFQSGVARGRADASTAELPTSEEDGR
jgi:hypothetical protein